MLLRSKIYLLLNRLLGATTEITRKEDDLKNKSSFDLSTIPYLKKENQYFSKDSRVLIIGCGAGDEAVWLSKKCKYVAGVDVSKRAIEISKTKISDNKNIDFFLIKKTMLFKEDSFDTIFMNNACEHIIDIAYWFSEYHRILKKDGVLINNFGPLFYSPFGAHLFDLLKFPWGHLIFGFNSTQELRNMFYPNYSNATNWFERGLNKVTENKYLQIVKETKFTHKYYKKSTAKNIPFLGSVPIIKNLFINHIENILLK